MPNALKAAVRPGKGGWIARLWTKIRRPSARIDHLNEHMLRDIGMDEEWRGSGRRRAKPAIGR